MSDKLFSIAAPKWNGWIDGRKGIPSLEDNTPTPFENRLRDKANQVISKIYGRWQKIDAKLGSQLQEAQSRHIQASRNYTQSQEASGRDARHKPYWYYPFNAILGVVELYINRQVFVRIGIQNGEKIANHESWFLAAVLAFVPPVAGHFLGRFLREDLWNKTRLCLATSITIGAISTSLFLSWLRVDTIRPSGGSGLDVKLLLFFASLNWLVFAVATTVSYFCHEPHPDIREDKENFEKSERNLRVAEAKRNAHRAVYQNRAEGVKNRYYELDEIYRQANVRSRKDGIPKAFKQMPPDLEMPSFDPAESAELKPVSPDTMDGASVAKNHRMAASEDGHSTNQKLKPEEGIS